MVPNKPHGYYKLCIINCLLLSKWIFFFHFALFNAESV